MPAHGVSSAVIEPDPAFYRAVCHTGANRRPFDPAQKRLIIPVEYRCNLDCMFCYLPDRTKPNLSCERIERAIRDFDGDSIELSGGEPTLREDLLDLVRLVGSTANASTSSPTDSASRTSTTCAS